MIRIQSIQPHRIILMSIAIAVFLALPLTGFQQEASTLLDLRGDLIGLQDEFTVGQERAEVLYQQNLQQGPVSTRSSIFFDVSNIGIWLLWVIMLGFLLLMFALHRNISEFYEVYAAQKTGHVSSTMPQTAVQQPKASPQSLSPDTAAPRRSLVQPEKIVKIKVRKITKTKSA